MSAMSRLHAIANQSRETADIEVERLMGRLRTEASSIASDYAPIGSNEASEIDQEYALRRMIDHAISELQARREEMLYA